MAQILKRKKATKGQIESIIHFMEDNPLLLKGQLTNDFTAAKRQKMWQSLADVLNSSGGAVKSVEKWQKVC